MDAKVAGAVYFLRGYFTFNGRNYPAEACSLGALHFLPSVRRLMPAIQHDRLGTDR